ncbi:hypothetical protein NNO_0714 [Hydrogenimonas sp.]|nr:hypothetical protein NNO_0714 [Hydrogenimonas sp.]
MNSTVRKMRAITAVFTKYLFRYYTTKERFWKVGWVQKVPLPMRKRQCVT